MIKVERVYKSFDEPVLRGCTFSARRGELVGLIGPPASGKSVLLRAIAGLEAFEAGSIIVAGQELMDASESTVRQVRGHIGMLFQNVALFDFMTVYENVAFPLRRIAKLGEDEIAQRVHFELGAVGLSSLKAAMPARLSGGQKRRVGLARAAISRPRVLLYDEPAAGLDPVTTSRTFALLKEQRRRLGATIVVVSSDIDRLLPLVDRIAVMHQGRVIFQGTHAELALSHQPLIRQFIEGQVDGPL